MKYTPNIRNASAGRSSSSHLNSGVTLEFQSAEVDEVEHWVHCSGGGIYAKSWTPPSLASEESIVLFHDSLGCVALWKEFPSQLAKATGRRVIAYDRLGFGRSERRANLLDKEFMGREATDVVPYLLDALSVGYIVACGHSVGGGMAVETGARLPEVCKGVVTIAAQAFVEDRTLEGIRKAQREFSTAESFSRLAKYHGDKTRWVLQSWTDTWQAPDFADWSLNAALDELQCPVLSIHGEHDEYGSTVHAHRIADGRGVMQILPNVGHNPHRESPLMLSATINSWLRSFDC